MEDNQQRDTGKSRTQKKKEDHARKRLGATLVTLSDDVLRGMDLPEDLHEAVMMAKQATSHGARRRQLQYIGSLMRRIDTEPIRLAIEDIAHGNRSRAAAFHRLERWRDELCAGNAALMEDILTACPGADRQRLAQLVRNAAKAARSGAGKTAGRKLFRYLQDISDAASPGG